MPNEVINLNEVFNLKERDLLLNNSAFLIINFGPLVETIVFQLIIFKFFEKIFNEYDAIIITAILFGLSHMYDIHYVAKTTNFGLIQTTCFVFLRRRSSTLFALSYVYVFHSLNNFIAYNLRFFLVNS